MCFFTGFYGTPAWSALTKTWSACSECNQIPWAEPAFVSFITCTTATDSKANATFQCRTGYRLDRKGAGVADQCNGECGIRALYCFVCLLRRRKDVFEGLTLKGRSLQR